MLYIVSQEEVDARNKRVRFLYTTDWYEDKITAALMDTSHGGSGLAEGVARAKATAILSWADFMQKRLCNCETGCPVHSKVKGAPMTAQTSKSVE